MAESTRWMLDTNMVSYALKGNVPAVRARMMRLAPSALCISAVTKSELLYGVAKSPAASRIAGVVMEFLRWIHVVDWTGDVAALHGELRAGLQRRGITMGGFDLMIAAHALALDLTLVTNDQAFANVKHLRLENWALGD
jgi:tRNA(fMet)-specific endonuclease VapC